MTKLLETIWVAITIATHAAFMLLRKKVLSAVKEVSVYSLEIFKGEALVGITTMPENPLVRLLKVEKKIKVLAGKAFRTIKDTHRYPFSKQIISVKFRRFDLLGLVLKGLYVKFNGVKTKFYVKASDDRLKNLLTGKLESVDLVMNQDGSLKKDVRKYIFLFASPSMLRAKQCLFIDATEGLGFIENILLRVTGGAYGLVVGTEVTLKGLVKIFSRMAQSTASMRDIGPVDSYIFFDGKFDDLLLPGGNKDTKKWDGMGFVEATYFAKLMSGLLGITVSFKAVLGKGIQARPLGTAVKSLMVVVSRRFINGLLKQGEIVHFGTITPEIQKRIWGGEFRGKWIHIGPGAPQLVLDRNAIKIEFDMCREQRFELLDIAKVSEAWTSGQILQKFVDQPEMLQKLINELFEDMYNDAFQSILTRRPRIPGIMELNKGALYLVDILGKIAPRYVAGKDTQMFISLLQTKLKSAVGNINRHRYPIAGGNYRAISDIGELFGFGPILEPNVIFSRHAARVLRDREDKTAVGFKYPTVGFDEMHTFRVVGMHYIRRRLKVMETPNWFNEIVREYYGHLDEALVTIATEALLKAKLAGMDFDYDMLTLIWHKLLVLMSRGRAKEVVEIIDDVLIKTKQQDEVEINDVTMLPLSVGSIAGKFVVGLESFKTAFVANVRNGNKSIGLVTRINDVILSLLSASHEDAVRGLKILLKIEEEGNEKYIPLKRIPNSLGGVTVQINDLLTNQVIEGARKAKLSPEAVYNIILDLNVVYRRLQEKTIDAPKTGDQLTYPVDMEGIMATSLLDYNVELDWHNKKIRVDKSMPEELEEDIITGDVFLVDDVLGQIKREQMDTLGRRLQGFLSNLPAFNEEDLSLFASAADTDKVKSLEVLKYAYNDLTKAWVQSELDSEIKTPDYKENLQYLGNMVRRITKGLEPSERGLLAKHVSILSRDGQIADSSNKFASAVIPEEYLLMVNKHFGEIEFAGEEIVNDGYIDGDMVTFTDGIAEKAATVKEAISGEFVIRRQSGRWFATKPIAEVVRVPEINEDQLVVSLDARDLTEKKYTVAMGRLSDAIRIKLFAANRKHGDVMYAMLPGQDKPIRVGRIRVPIGRTILSDLYDGAVGTVQKAVYTQIERESTGKIYNSIIVVMNVEKYDKSPNTDERKRTAAAKKVTTVVKKPKVAVQKEEVVANDPLF